MNSKPTDLHKNSPEKETLPASDPLFIHPTACVDEGCLLGNGCKVWHYSHLMPGSRLGENCIIGQNVFIAGGVILGNGCKVQNNVSLYTGITCEEGVFLGPSCVFTNVTNPRAFIERKTKFRPTLVKKGASIGANATILCGNTIGEYALIGAGAVVTTDAKAFGLYTGCPARHSGWVSRRGCILHFNEEGIAHCPENGEKYILKEDTVTQIK